MVRTGHKGIKGRSDEEKNQNKIALHPRWIPSSRKKLLISGDALFAASYSYRALFFSIILKKGNIKIYWLRGTIIFQSVLPLRTYVFDRAPSCFALSNPSE